MARSFKSKKSKNDSLGMILREKREREREGGGEKGT